jgi:metal-sulfur cluster biosynthetic enzyme
VDAHSVIATSADHDGSEDNDAYSTTRRLAKDDLESALVAALSRVLDPCSVAAGMPLDIVEMGMLAGWSIDSDRNLQVAICVTTPMCLQAHSILEVASRELAASAAFNSIQLRVDTEVIWTEDRLSDTARAKRRKRIQTSPLLRNIMPADQQ